jgi:Rha family phage regulatory protein
MSKVLVFKKEGKIVTDSLTVANEFGKRHADVLRKIEGCKVDLPADWCERNFALTSQTVEMPNGGTREETKYDLTRDGWMYAVMGFTGKKAAAVRLVFISEFNRMEAELVGRGIQKAPLTIDDWYKLAKEQEARADRAEATIASIDRAPAKYARTKALKGKEIYAEWKVIQLAVDSWIPKQTPNKNMTLGGWTTCWLKSEMGVQPQVREHGPRDKTSQLFDRADIEALVAKLLPGGEQ